MNATEWLRQQLLNNWNQRLMGECVECNVELMKGEENNYSTQNIGSSFSPVDLLVANISAALSTSEVLGTATDQNLKSVKTQMDVSAGHVFAESLHDAKSFSYVAASEAKDETGNLIDDPISKVSKMLGGGVGIAVDVIDGTTLAALGLPGAYTLSAAASALRKFPDLQAYAIMGPDSVCTAFNFFEASEIAAKKFVQDLCEFYKKEANELRIVTHSFDTGSHHSELIEVLNELGVNVIVPNPVIVEPPYTLSCALKTKESPHALIGVFGLPEIVINTVLLGIIDTDCCIRFRIASNSMLRFENEKNLSRAFHFTEGESELLKKMNLGKSQIFDVKSIVEQPSDAAFAATCLTTDDILGISGISAVDSNAFALQTVFSGLNGPTFKLTTKHRLGNRINYGGVYSQKIDDLSLIVPINKGPAFEFCELVLAELASTDVDFLVMEDPKNLHATLYEFGVHYGGTDRETLELAIAQCKEIVVDEELDKPVVFRTGKLRLAKNSVILELQLDRDFSTLQLSKKLNGPFFNAMRACSSHYITLARLKSYLTPEELAALSRMLNDLQPKNQEREIPETPRLVHIESTPFYHREI